LGRSEVKSLGSLISHFGEKEGLRIGFEDIIKVDYRAIYTVASQVVNTLPPDNLFQTILKLGSKLSSEQNIIRRDFSGKLYHKIVGDWSIRKGFATYFTTISASHLLAHLSVFSNYHALRDPENITVCDFTCGSGTLLSASYSALEDAYKLEKFEEGDIDLDEFHKKVLENNFWGFDALRFALQIASLNLVFQNPSIPLSNMHFHSIPLGVNQQGEVELGSLRFLKSGTLTDYFALEDVAKKVTTIDVEEKTETIPFFDLIIMNPPFTRATGRGGKEGGGLFGFLVDSKIRNKVLTSYEQFKERVNESLVKECYEYLHDFEAGTFKRIALAGEGLLFLYLASQHLSDEGRMSFVLPRSFLSGASWFLIRALILKKFQLEYVIVSYDKEGGYNFSESTNLSEVMIVARKTKDENSQATVLSCCLKNPLLQ
jgi:type I restriction-modification system DNA methylase subunit